MKKSIALILAILIMVSLCACGGGDTTSTDAKAENNKLDGVGSVTESVADNTLAPTTAPAPTEPSRPVPQNFLFYDETDIAHVMGTRDVGRDEVMSVTFLDTLKDKPSDAWDASQNKDGSVMAWIDDDGNLFVAGEGGVTATNCKKLFDNYYKAEYIDFNDCFYTDLVEEMSHMFASCKGLTDLDLSFFNTSKVKYMDEMFSYSTSLENIDLSSFDTSHVFDMDSMFQLTSIESIDLSSFNTKRVNDMSYMFDYCDDLKTLDLSNFNTANVTDMGDMFSNCESLTTVDLSSFDFSALESAENMFYACKNLTDVCCTITLPEGCKDDGMYKYSAFE